MYKWRNWAKQTHNLTQLHSGKQAKKNQVSQGKSSQKSLKSRAIFFSTIERVSVEGTYGKNHTFFTQLARPHGLQFFEW